MYKKVIHKLSKLNKNQVLIGVAVLAILVTGVLVSNKSLAYNVLSLFKSTNQDAIAKNAVDFLNKSVLQQGQVATLEGVSEESGLIKIKLKIGSNTYDSYATRDGKLLFPEAFKIDSNASAPVAANPNAPADNGPAVTPATVAKVDKPALEAYIVSSCPFGLQAQRAMAEAIKTAPALADYIKVRYIGSISGDTTVAMHGPDEAKNDRIQMCIREEQPTKYWAYVGCYMKTAAGKAANGMPYGDAENCQKTASVDTAKLNACMSDPNRVLKYAKEDFDLANKIGAQGSPTFSLNGSEVSENAFGGRSAKGMAQMICSSSKTPPSFCKDAQFSTDPASTSFSLSYAAPGGTGATANCAPAT